MQDDGQPRVDDPVTELDPRPRTRVGPLPGLQRLARIQKTRPRAPVLPLVGEIGPDPTRQGHAHEDDRDAGAGTEAEPRALHPLGYA